MLTEGVNFLERVSTGGLESFRNVCRTGKGSEVCGFYAEIELMVRATCAAFFFVDSPPVRRTMLLDTWVGGGGRIPATRNRSRFLLGKG